MNSRKTLAFLLLLAIPAGFAAVWRLQRGIDGQLAGMHQEEDELVLRSGKMLRLLSLEYGSFLADVYWTRAVQYYGDRRVRRVANLETLGPLLDVTTTLDPQLLPAYQFGAVFLSGVPPQGAGRPDLAVKLIQKGIKNNPDYWRLYYDLGFIYYWELKDYKKASDAFLEGSKNPDAMFWMKVLAAKVAAEGRSLDTSKMLWREIYESSKDKMVRETALRNLKILRAEEDCEYLDVLVARYAKSAKRRPERLEELVTAGILPGVPVDPEGSPYELEADGKAHVNPKSPLQSLLKNPPPPPH